RLARFDRGKQRAGAVAVPVDRHGVEAVEGDAGRLGGGLALGAGCEGQARAVGAHLLRHAGREGSEVSPNVGGRREERAVLLPEVGSLAFDCVGGVPVYDPAQGAPDPDQRQADHLQQEVSLLAVELGEDEDEDRRHGRGRDGYPPPSVHQAGDEGQQRAQRRQQRDPAVWAAGDQRRAGQDEQRGPGRSARSKPQCRPLRGHLVAPKSRLVLRRGSEIPNLNFMPGPLMTVSELLRIADHLDPRGQALVRNAVERASSAHSGQRRLSGEDYVNHPLEVAAILADLELDAETIAAALLHDTVEDTNLTAEELKREFGPEVARLVDGVTKLGRISLRTDQQQHAENIRKMMVAMAEDLRVVLIKLADRLHNMRTLQPLAEAKR